MQINDLDSQLFVCPPTKLEILLAWFTVHWILGIVLVILSGWMLTVLGQVLRAIFHRG